MNSYLYTWNPNRWTWKHLQLAADDIAAGNRYVDRWSCGTTRKIVPGDLFFLVKVGVDPKGIVGCGYVVSEPYEDTHWDSEKASNGIAALRTDIEFIALSPQPLIPLSTLQQRHPEYTWTPQNGGRQIPDDISKDLLQIIQDGAAGTLELRTPEKQQQYREGAVKTVTLKTYDRCPAARQACIDHYGYKCVVCNFDFEQAYGEMGTKYIEVHHVTQIADIGAEYEVDPIRDLRPVCGNCHAMVHRQRPPMSVDQLRELLRARAPLLSE